ncbi:MAG: anti-sigma factor family protein [Desulfobacca sp.]
MDCREVQEKLSAYLDGELSPRQQELVARHLDGCQACRRELQIWQQLWEALLREPVAAPADLTARVLARLPGRQRQWWQNLALAASLLLGIILGGQLGLAVQQTTVALQVEAAEAGWEGFEATPAHSLNALLVSYDLENGNGS